MNITYILIDFENVQPAAEDMSLIRGAGYRVSLFHGQHQNRFDAAMVKALHPLGSQLEYIQGGAKGKNALDFHIAFYLGRLVEACQATSAPFGAGTAFVIVSKDTGFDALLEVVRAAGYLAVRSLTISDALAFSGEKKVERVSVASTKSSLAKEATPKSTAPVVGSAKKPSKSASSPPKAAKVDPYQRTLKNLRDRPNNRPSKLASLEHHVGTLLGKGTTQQAVKKVIARLQAEGIMAVNGDKIAWNLTEGSQ